MVTMGGLLGSLWRFLITIVVSAIVIWVAQKVVLPSRKEKQFVSAVALAFLWAIIDAVLDLIFSFLHLGVIGWLVTLVVWVWVLKSWFDIGWGAAALISFVAWIISLILGILWGIVSVLT